MIFLRNNTAFGKILHRLEKSGLSLQKLAVCEPLSLPIAAGP
jgi:hypothetical protein